VPVTPGFIEERIYNLAEIHRLEKELEACQGGRLTHLASFNRATFKCTVRGSLYTNQGAGSLTERIDGCHMLDVSLKDEGLVVSYHATRVIIPVPLSGGHMQWAYTWGSLVATIGGHEVPIHVETVELHSNFFLWYW
jgi:hypothetical protein